MLLYGFLYIHPQVQLTYPAVMSIYLVISTVAVITFLLPQFGIHQLQQEEKERLLAEINQRVQDTIGPTAISTLENVRTQTQTVIS